MKRIYTFDFLRGFAIIAMILFHRILWDYYFQTGGIAGTSDTFGFFIITLFASMAGIFFCISGAVNTYMNFNRLKEGNITPRQVLLKSVVSGFFLIIISLFFLYFMMRNLDDVVMYSPISGNHITWNQTGVLPYLILYGEYPAKYNLGLFFEMSTLPMIGYSLISVSLILAINFKRKRGDNFKRLRIIFLILGIVFFTGNGLIRPLFGEFIYLQLQSNNYIAHFFLSPIVLGTFPIFPHLSFGFFGAFFGIEFAQKNRKPKKVLKSMLLFWVILLSFGIIMLAVCLPLGIKNTWYYIWGYKSFQLGLYFLLFWLGMKYIDYQPEEIKEKRMKWMKPLVTVGRVTLTIFILEGIIAVSLQRLVMLFWPGWNATMGSTFLFALINLAVWGIIIVIWKQFKFKGSLEYTSAWLIKKLSGQASSKNENRPD